MPKRSAGLLLYRVVAGVTEVLLVHPGGPFWAKRDAGAWSIPKGEYADGDDPREAALREFEEETGTPAPSGAMLDLGEAVQKSRKIVRAFACRGDLDVTRIRSNQVEIEWPPRSGLRLLVPEIDRGAWFGPDEARAKLHGGQAVFLDRLGEMA